MQTLARAYPGISGLISFTMDRIVIPLAVVVGLAGGAMIGAELFHLQAPEPPHFH